MVPEVPLLRDPARWGGRNAKRPHHIGCQGRRCALYPSAASISAVRVFKIADTSLATSFIWGKRSGWKSARSIRAHCLRINV